MSEINRADAITAVCGGESNMLIANKKVVEPAFSARAGDLLSIVASLDLLTFCYDARFHHPSKDNDIELTSTARL